MNKCKYELRDGYYIFSDFNFCRTEYEMKRFKQTANLDNIRKGRNELLLKTYEFLGVEEFMKLTHILTNSCIDSYFDVSVKDNECDYHHCCECWEKQIRELKK